MRTSSLSCADRTAGASVRGGGGRRVSIAAHGAPPERERGDGEILVRGPESGCRVRRRFGAGVYSGDLPLEYASPILAMCVLVPLTTVKNAALKRQVYGR